MDETGKLKLARPTGDHGVGAFLFAGGEVYQMVNTNEFRR